MNLGRNLSFLSFLSIWSDYVVLASLLHPKSYRTLEAVIGRCLKHLRRCVYHFNHKSCPWVIMIPPCPVVIYTFYIKPPSTTRPTPATSLFTPPRLLSSNSFTTPCTMIFRTRASAFENNSATIVLQSFGDETRLMSLA